MAAVAKSTVTQAVDALVKWKSAQSETQKAQLLPQDDFIYLILTLKKIPQKGGANGARTNPYKISLPNPLLSPASFPEVCLIIDDRPNSKLTSEIAKKKIKADGISVTKVIKLSKLKTDYKPFEAKRKLCDSYEMFFADKRVITFLPKLLGKHFFKKKKLPLPMDLTHKNWKEQIEKAFSSGLLFLNTGTCSVVRVAKASMERDEIIENVSAAIDGVVGFVPKQWAGVRSFHLKFSESVALPLYQALPEIKLRIEGIKEKNVEEHDGEIVVKDQASGGKKKSSKKQGRIHEIDYEVDEDQLDSDIGGDEIDPDEDEDEDKLDSDIGGDDMGDEVNEKEELGSAQLARKKRKGEITSEGNGEKPTKRSGKDKKGAKDDSSGKKRRKEGDVVTMNDHDTKNEEKSAKKKHKGDAELKEKKKGRSMSKALKSLIGKDEQSL